MGERPGFVPDPPIRCRDYRIGALGAGFIMADVQLASYAEAGFPIAAIASRTRSKAEEVANRWGIPKVHDDPIALIADPDVEILDIAYPPDQQPDLIREALRQKHIKAILAQKPLALDFATAKAVIAEAKTAGKMLIRQPEHAVRPVDAGLKTDPRPARTRRAGACDDRDAGDSALAAVPCGLRPADASQHERASPRRAAFSARRPRRDLHCRAHGSTHQIRPHATGSASPLCAFRPARSRCRSRMCGLARTRTGSKATSTSSGAWRGPRALRTARSAGPIIRKAARARFAIPAGQPAENG